MRSERRPAPLMTLPHHVVPGGQMTRLWHSHGELTVRERKPPAFPYGHQLVPARHGRYPGM